MVVARKDRRSRGSNLEQLVHSPLHLGGTLSVPGDKSISHRALILNALARGQSRVTGLSDGYDTLSTIRCLHAMGVSIQTENQSGVLIIQGTNNGFQEPTDVLDAGNSGTSMRLLAGILATQPGLSVLTGDSSLCNRPMDRIVRPLKQMGAQILGRHNDTLPPLVMRGGRLRGIEYTMPVASAQVKSCLLLAGLSADRDMILHQPAPSRDHTERMISAMGAHVETDGLTLMIHPTHLNAIDISVPGDISSAAFWLVAGICHPNARILIRGVGLNPSRSGIIETLQAMGVGKGLVLMNQRNEGGEPVADILASSSQLTSIEIGGDIIARTIDELPVLAVAACFATGTTVIRDANELHFKESDRIKTTVSELTQLGALIEAQEDGMVIHGTGRLAGAPCQSHGDHRLAMCLGIAGLLAQGETTIHGADAATVSYPNFWNHMDILTSDEDQG
jgi:3-phosphoshikimate 1-carboxyvinyltransferase